MNLKEARKVQINDVVRFKPTKSNPNGWGVVTLMFNRIHRTPAGVPYRMMVVEREGIDFWKIIPTNLLTKGV